MRVGTVFFEMQLCPIIDFANFVTRKNTRPSCIVGGYMNITMCPMFCSQQEHNLKENFMYENLCDELLSIIPNISWDVEGVEAIKRAVKILSSLQEEEAYDRR